MTLLHRRKRQFQVSESVTIYQSRLLARDLASEAMAGIVQRPGRSALTLVGIVLGIGTLVTIVGLSQSANAQVSKQFNVLEATQVTVSDVGDSPGHLAYDFPINADQLIDRLRGVDAAGVWWQSPESPAVSLLPENPGQDSFTLYGITPGIIPASGATLTYGANFSSFEDEHRANVAIIGRVVAQELGLTSLRGAPAIFVGGQPFTIIGVMASNERLPQLALGILIPAQTALAIWGPPVNSSPASMLIHTRLGAAALISSQAALALNPIDPALFSAAPPPEFNSLRQSVVSNLNSLFLALAAIAVAVGAIGIANTTSVAILERREEIGLRRALGARRHHVALQFLAESTVLGFLGGLFGSALGVLVVLIIVTYREWTAVLTPGVVLVAPFLGALVGLLAGMYPSIRATKIEPAHAMRR